VNTVSTNRKKWTYCKGCLTSA